MKTMLLTFFLGYVACASVRNYMMYRLDSRTDNCLKAVVTNTKEEIDAAFVCIEKAQWSATEKALMLYYRKGE